MISLLILFVCYLNDFSILTPLDDDGTKESQTKTIPVKRSEMLCMIGIPANVPCVDLLNFIMPFK